MTGLGKLLILICALVGPVAAQEVLVVTEEYPPYNFTDENRRISGLSTEVVEEVLRRAGLTYSIQSLPWARAYQTAQQDANVLIYSIGRNAEREAKFKWVGAIAHWNVHMIKLKRRADVRASRLEDLRSYVLGGVRDDVRTQYLTGEGFTLDLVTDDISNIRKLQLDRIDAFPADELQLRALAVKAGVEIDTMEKFFKLDKLFGELYMAFSLKTPDSLVARCRAALESLRKDGGLRRIDEKWRK